MLIGTLIISPVANVHELDSIGMQAIHLAVERGNLGATLALIEKFESNMNERRLPVEAGKRPNGVPPYSASTPLIIAIAITKNNLKIF